MVQTWFYNGIIMVYKGLSMAHEWSHNGPIMVYKRSIDGT